MPRSSPPPAPEIPEVFTLYGVDYFLDWRKLEPGNSFFIPTTATPKQVKAVLKESYKDLPYTFEIHARCEYGRYGVRVWRVY
jgi:hypothetical protein